MFTRGFLEVLCKNRLPLAFQNKRMAEKSAPGNGDICGKIVNHSMSTKVLYTVETLCCIGFDDKKYSFAVTVILFYFCFP
jgi:hypothetical protein